MTDSLTKNKLVTNLRDFFSKNQLTLVEDNDICTISNPSGTVNCTINLDSELEEELGKITMYLENTVVINKQSLQFILTSNKDTQEEIELEGAYKGKIKEFNENLYGLITTNCELLDISNLSSTSYEIKDLIKEKLYVCEIELIQQGKNPTESDIDRIKYSIINDVLYYKLIHFKVFGEKQVNTLNLKVKNVVNTFPYIEDIPLKYFILAEEIEFLNFKYLEYYHIIEYYFMEYSKNKITEIMKELISNVFIKNKKLDEDFLYNTYKQFMNPHKLKVDEFKEDYLITELFKSLDYNLVVDTIKESSITNIVFLTKDLNNVQNIKINIDDCFSTDKKKLNRNSTIENQKQFLIKLSERIYKIRNYIVHTKKGEINNLVFHPSHKNLDELKNDVLLIREISRLILIKSNIIL